MFINNFLGTKQLPEQAQHIFRSFLLLSFVTSFLFNLSSTFYILYAIENIGFTLAAVMTSIMLLAQVFFDYPSGSLGDWIGQRWVLTIAVISYSVGYFFLLIAQSVTSFLIIGFIFGFGNAQFSGALSSWLDSNYQSVALDVDTERKTYGFAMSRIATLDNIALSSAFLIGGALATVISRQFVFFVQACFSLFVILVILTLVKDIKKKKAESKKEDSLQNYISFLKGGVSFLLSSKIAFFFIVGWALYNVTWLIWGSLILFPLYFGYSGSDSVASILRTLIFLIGIPIGIYNANASKRIKNDKFPFFIILQLLLFFPGYVILTTLIPPTNELNIVGLIFTLILQNSLVSFLFRLANILRQRIMVDLVPSEYRNAIYSLIPTIISLIGIPVLPIVGRVIEDLGITAGIAIAGGVSLFGAISLFISIYLMKRKTRTAQIETMKQPISLTGVN
ncbi:MAG: MFS transporter [Candidatus Hermodarchaeota archaeon]